MVIERASHHQPLYLSSVCGGSVGGQIALSQLTVIARDKVYRQIFQLSFIFGGSKVLSQAISHSISLESSS